MAYIMHDQWESDKYRPWDDGDVVACPVCEDVCETEGGSPAFRPVGTHQQASCQDGTCFASVLEQDIATLEAEAQRDGHASWDFITDHAVGSCETAMNKAMSDDLGSCDHDQASDSGSASDSEQPESAALSQIRANAQMVLECGKPLQLGAWKGCCKSPWCDREDRHRGLCNHKATIPGPAACPAQSVDTCSSESQFQACCAGLQLCSMQQQQADELSSGGHSYNCNTHEAADGDEREVASALKAGACLHHQQSMEDTSVPFSLPQQQHAGQEEQAQQQQQQLPELFCFGCSTSGRDQAPDEQLFALPALYQPRVKDLESPDISSILSRDGLCSMEVEVALDVPVQPVKLEDLDTSTMDTSSQTYVKPGTPSSPSCASAAAMAESAAFAVQLQVHMPAVLPVGLMPAAATAVAAAPAAVPVAAVCLAGMLPLQEVHPPSSSTAAFAAEAAPGVAAAEAAAKETPSSPTDGDATTAAAAAAAAAETPEADAAAAPTAATAAAACETSPTAPNTNSASKKAAGSKASKASSKQQASAADTSSGSPAAAAAPALPPPMSRVPRIKHKPRRADDPPRNLLEPSSSSSSPKSKKRPAARMAPAPSSGHSCTQCGAVSTPVWRAGPAGPKTLCNACGVRYMKTARRK